MKSVLAQLVDGVDLDESEMQRAVGLIMDGQATPAQVGAFLAALHVKGETSVELTAAVRAMRERSLAIDAGGCLLDTCGTGGDGLGTFNISTAVAFVAAARGIRVAKHGNRAASGRVGAADVLEALGVRIDLPVEESRQALERFGFTFLFAPLYHPAVKHVALARREVGFRTLFNLTGPLCNPAGATHQLVGLYSGEWLQPVAMTLRTLGAKRAMVVHGGDGSDEITTVSPTAVVELKDGRLETYSLDPLDFGVARASSADLAGGDRDHNADTIRRILGGETGPAADIVAVNAAAAIYLADQAETVAAGLGAARETLASGKALELLDEFAAFTRGEGR
ncbi:MAG: anthranilate phosphoribosyltransferase [Candidatus Binatia bacterium]